MTEQEKALYSVVFRLSSDNKDVVNACIKDLLENSSEKVPGTNLTAEKGRERSFL